MLLSGILVTKDDDRINADSVPNAVSVLSILVINKEDKETFAGI